MRIFRNAVLAVSALLLASCAYLEKPGAPAIAVAPPPDPATAREAADFGTYLSARFAAGEQDLGDAARYYNSSLQDSPDDPDLLALAFFYDTVAGNVDEAGALAARVAAQSPSDRAACLALAMVALKKGDYAGARKVIALSEKEPVTTITVALVDAWAAAGAGDAAAAQSDMTTLAVQDGAAGLAAFHAALIADYERNEGEADADYRKALAGGNPSPRVLEAYGRFLARAGRVADARALYAAHADQDALLSVTEAGLAALAAGAKPDALAPTPQDGVAEGLFGIAASLNDPSNVDVSILYLRFALYLRPDLALGQILLGSRFEELEKYDEAIALYRRVAKTSPYYAMAAVEAAIDESRENKTDQAIADLKALAEAEPANSDAWIALGDTDRAAEKYQDAVAAYGHAVAALKPPAARDWSLFYARANAEESARDWTAAEADLNQALKLSPNQPDVLNFLGYSWVDQGRRIPEALTMLEKARTLSPGNGYVIDSVGWAYYRLGRYADAVNLLEQAVLLVPGDPTINDHLGDALWQVGRRMEARFQWNHALAFDPDADEKASLEKKLLSGPAANKPV